MGNQSENNRPHLSRVERQHSLREAKKNKNSHWISLILVLIIIVIAIFPIVLQRSNSVANEQTKTVQSSKNIKKTKKSSKPAKNSSKKSSSKTSSNASNQSASSTNTYTVQSGDTWASIASRYDMTADELAQLNGLSTDSTLSIGQTLSVK